MYGTFNGLSSVQVITFTGSQPALMAYLGVGDEFGAFVTTADINGDGFRRRHHRNTRRNASRSRNNAGAVHVLYGTNNGTTTDKTNYSFTSPNHSRNSQTNALFGSSIITIRRRHHHRSTRNNHKRQHQRRINLLPQQIITKQSQESNLSSYFPSSRQLHEKFLCAL